MQKADVSGVVVGTSYCSVILLDAVELGNRHCCHVSIGRTNENNVMMPPESNNIALAGGHAQQMLDVIFIKKVTEEINEFLILVNVCHNENPPKIIIFHGCCV